MERATGAFSMMSSLAGGTQGFLTFARISRAPPLLDDAGPAAPLTRVVIADRWDRGE